jgi:hypothetical protein
MNNKRKMKKKKNKKKNLWTLNLSWKGNKLKTSVVWGPGDFGLGIGADINVPYEICTRPFPLVYEDGGVVERISKVSFGYWFCDSFEVHLKIVHVFHLWNEILSCEILHGFIWQFF